MKQNDLNAQISNISIKKVRDFLLQSLDSTDDNGEPDLKKIIHNATYNMGEVAIEIGGLIMQERLKRDGIAKQLREKRSEAYQELQTTRMGWTPTQSGIQIMLDGSTDVERDENGVPLKDAHSVSELTSMLARQDDYIDFLKAAQEQIRYYPKNAKYLVDISNVGREIGKLI